MSDSTLDDQLTKALAAHNRWKLRLHTAIAVGKFDAKLEDVRRCDLCEFGKWIEGDSIDSSLKSDKPYMVTRRLHRDFHEAAATVLGHALKGQPDKAREAMDGRYKERSEKLTRAITLWRSEVRAG